MNNKFMPSHHFIVELGGINRLEFSEVYGLDFIREVIETNEGSNAAQLPMKQPGLTKYSNIVLKRGAIKNDLSMYQWWKEKTSDTHFRDVVIKVLDEKHEPVLSFLLIQAFPVRVSYSQLQAGVSQILMEETELAFQDMDIRI